MTADVELLPLPEHTEAGEFTFDAHVFEHMDMVSYARAVAEHNVAAKDAEIEALRAELDRLRGEHVRVRRDRNAAEARAERLAEALLEARWMIRGLLPDATYTKWDDLLREHGQETSNG